MTRNKVSLRTYARHIAIFAAVGVHGLAAAQNQSAPQDRPQSRVPAQGEQPVSNRTIRIRGATARGRRSWESPEQHADQHSRHDRYGWRGCVHIELWRRNDHR